LAGLLTPVLAIPSEGGTFLTQFTSLVEKKTAFYRQIAGNIHLTHYGAVCSIDPGQARQVMKQTRA
jgi:hypothetical protein